MQSYQICASPFCGTDFPAGASAVVDAAGRAYCSPACRDEVEAAEAQADAKAQHETAPYPCLGCPAMITSLNLCEECGRKNGAAIAAGQDFSSNYGMDARPF